MTSNEKHLSPERAAERRLAAVRATRVKVDHNGRPLGPPVTYRYDSDGLLIAAEPDNGQHHD